MKTKTRDELLATKLAGFPSQYENVGYQISLERAFERAQQFLVEIETGEVRPGDYKVLADDKKVSKELKSDLPPVRIASSVPDKRSGVPTKATGLFFADIDTFKKLDPELRESCTKGLIEALNAIPGLVAFWRSSSLGVHAIFAYDTDGHDLVEDHKLMQQAMWSFVEKRLRSMSALSDDIELLDPACKSPFQLCYFPPRRFYFSKTNEVELVDLSEEIKKIQETERAKAEELVKKKENLKTEWSAQICQKYTASECDRALLNWTSWAVNFIKSPDCSVNEAFMKRVRDLARFESGNPCSSSVVDECKNLLIAAAEESTGNFGVSDNELTSGTNCGKRSERIRRDFERHFATGKGMQPKILEIYSPGTGEKGEKEMIGLSSSIITEKDNKSNKNEDTKVMIMPGVTPVERPEMGNIENETIDIFNQPEETRRLDEDSLKALMFNAFCKNYRVVQGKFAQILELKTGILHEPSETPAFLNKNKWFCSEIKIKSKKPQIIEKEVSFADALSGRSPSSYSVALIENYDFAPLSLVQAKPSLDSPAIQPCFNVLHPLALSEEMKNRTIDPESLEAKKAKEIISFVRERFQEEEDKQRCLSYYAAWVCDIIDNPTRRCGTNLGFFCKNGSTGKTTVADTLPVSLIGRYHCVQVKIRNDGFSFGCERRLLGHFSEVTELDSRGLNDLKTLVDTDYIAFNDKFKPATQIQTFCRVTATTNFPERFGLVDKDDRRWSVFFLEKPVTEEEKIQICKFLNDLGDNDRFHAAWPAYDAATMRAALYQALKVEAQKNTFDLHTSLPTKAKEKMVGSLWRRTSVVKWAINYLTGAPCEILSFRGKNTCPFLRAHLFKLLAQKRADDVKNTYDSTQIVEKLMASKLFDLTQEDKHSRQEFVFLLPSTFAALEYDEKAGYLACLKQHKSVNPQIFTPMIKIIEAEISRENLEKGYEN